jgi:hypothetical protein
MASMSPPGFLLAKSPNQKKPVSLRAGYTQTNPRCGSFGLSSAKLFNHSRRLDVKQRL